MTMPPRSARRRASRSPGAAAPAESERPPIRLSTNVAAQMRPPVMRQQQPPRAAQPPQSVQPPTQIFGTPGKAVQLAGQEWHLNKFTVGGLTEVQEYLTHSYPPSALAGDFDTGGEQIVMGLIQTRSYGQVQGLLNLIIYEKPEPNVLDCDPDQLVIVIDTFFETSGLRWLEKTMVRLGKAFQTQFMARLEGEMAPMMETALAEARAAMQKAMADNTASPSPSTSDDDSSATPFIETAESAPTMQASDSPS